VRQWVLTLPFELRFTVAFDRTLCRAVRAAFMGAVLSALRRRARRQGVADGRPGAVVCVQRFGGALNLNVHFHALVLDGVFHREPGRERPVFRAAQRMGEDDLAERSPALAGVQADSIAGRRTVRVGRLPGLGFVQPVGPDCVAQDGFTLHAGVCVPGGPRSRERLELASELHDLVIRRLESAMAREGLLSVGVHPRLPGAQHRSVDPETPGDLRDRPVRITGQTNGLTLELCRVRPASSHGRPFLEHSRLLSGCPRSRGKITRDSHSTPSPARRPPVSRKLRTCSSRRRDLSGAAHSRWSVPSSGRRAVFRGGHGGCTHDVGDATARDRHGGGPASLPARGGHAGPAPQHSAPLAAVALGWREALHRLITVQPPEDGGDWLCWGGLRFAPQPVCRS
jgi:hypothetical protein